MNAQTNQEKTAVQLNDISLSFYKNKMEIPLFKDLNMTFPQGKFVSLLGASGCGKSTLLRIISGITAADSGAIKFGKCTENQNTSPSSFMFQSATLFPWLNVLDNVLFPIKHTQGRVSKANIASAKELLFMVGLESCMQDKPLSLSGGMKQRVSLARALIQDNSLILMDEPFSALDALTREKLGIELRRIFNQKDKTILFVTHSIPEAVLLSDNIVILGGKPTSIIHNTQVNLPAIRDVSTLNDPNFHATCSSIREYVYTQQDATNA